MTVKNTGEGECSNIYGAPYLLPTLGSNVGIMMTQHITITCQYFTLLYFIFSRLVIMGVTQRLLRRERVTSNNIVYYYNYVIILLGGFKFSNPGHMASSH